MYIILKVGKSKMKVMVYTETGGLDVLKIQDIPKPKPNDNQVLIPVKAGALNIADILKINPYGRSVLKNNKEVYLTAKEFDLLLFLAMHSGQVFTKEQLYENVWGMIIYQIPVI